MSRQLTPTQKFEYCKKSKDNLYQMWKEFAKLELDLSDAKKQEYFNKRFNRIMEAFLNDKPDVICDETIVSDFLEWVEKQPKLSKEDIISVLQPKSAMLYELAQCLGSGRMIDKKMKEKYIRPTSTGR